MISPNPADPNSLLQAQLITPAEHSRIINEMQRGASAISATSLHTDDRHVWHRLGQTLGIPTFADHTDLKLIFADLFTHDLALETAFAPHITRGLITKVITYDPRSVTAAHPAFPGTPLHVTLVAPSIWRRIYDLAYPAALTGPLSSEQLTALISFTRTGERVTLSPEQRAEHAAILHNLRYIDPRREPVDDDLRHLLTANLKTLLQVYPHHIEGDALVTLMVNPTDAAQLQRLEQVTQRRIIPAVTTPDMIRELLERDDLTSNAESLDDALDRLTPYERTSG